MENAIMNLNDMPITMDEPATNPQYHPEPLHAAAFLAPFLDAFNKHIDMLVETRFNHLVQTRNTLALLDDSMEKKIEAMIENVILDHEISHGHWDKDEIEQIAADQARETLSEYAERQEGWVTKDQVQDIITEHVDEELDRIDWEEKVKDVLREML
jgi:hypothetical protein